MNAKKGKQVVVLDPFIKIRLFQRDFIPGFGGYVAGSVHKKPHAEILLNVGGMIGAYRMGDVPLKQLPYDIAASVVHEIGHVIEDWARVRFSEKKVEVLVEKYRRSYRAWNRRDKEGK